MPGPSAGPPDGAGGAGSTGGDAGGDGTGGGGPGRRAGGGVLAVTRYQLTLLVRGQRWLPPVVLLGFVLATATAGGPPPGDAFAFAAAGLVPSCTWLTRVVLTGDPPQARACLMAATGPARTQAGCVLAAVVAAAVLCLFSTAVIAGLVATGGTRAADGASSLPSFLAVTAGAGLVTGLACTLIGVAVGVVCNPPVTRRTDLAVLGSGLTVVLALAASGSPAYAAINDLSRASGQATPVGWDSLAVAAVVLGLAGLLSVHLATRRGVH